MLLLVNVLFRTDNLTENISEKWSTKIDILKNRFLQLK